MTFSMFSSVHVDALEWLLNVEDKLAAMEDVERKDLAAAKEQFQRHKAFLFEVEAQGCLLRGAGTSIRAVAVVAVLGENGLHMLVEGDHFGEFECYFLSHFLVRMCLLRGIIFRGRR